MKLPTLAERIGLKIPSEEKRAVYMARHSFASQGSESGACQDKHARRGLITVAAGLNSALADFGLALPFFKEPK